MKTQMIKLKQSYLLDANSTNIGKRLAGELSVDLLAELEIVRDGIVGIFHEGLFLGEVRAEHQSELTELVEKALQRSRSATAPVGLYRGPRKNWAVLAPEAAPRLSVRTVARELLRAGFPEASRDPGFEVRTMRNAFDAGSLRLGWARTGSLRHVDRTGAQTRSYKKSLEAIVTLLRRKGYSVREIRKVEGIPEYQVYRWRPRSKK